MQKTITHFDRAPWVAWVALAIMPGALIWSGQMELPFLTRSTFVGHVLGRDFVNYWMGARLFLAHRTDVLFNPTLYTQAITATWGSDLKMLSFSYPPSMLPLIGWLGLLPYPVAFGVWTVLGLLSLFAAAWPHSKVPWVAAAILFSPAVLACIDDGQNGLFTSALIVGALTRLDRQPILAGALIGILTAKPQLGILLPVALIAARRWRIIGAAAFSALCLFAVSLLVAGPTAWRLYLTKTAAYQGFLFQHTVGMWQAMTPSPAMSTIMAGGSWNLAWSIQAFVTVTMFALVAIVFAHRAARPITDLDRIFLVGATFLASPYSFNYDMPALAVFLFIASRSQPEIDLLRSWRWGSLMLLCAPLVMVFFGLSAISGHRHSPPVGALMVAIGLGLSLRVSPDQPSNHAASEDRPLRDRDVVQLKVAASGDNRD